MDQLPKKKELMDAILKVMCEGQTPMITATINKKVSDYLHIPQELLDIEDANCTGSEFSYRMRWARTELKKNGLILNIKRGEWGLAEEK